MKNPEKGQVPAAAVSEMQSSVLLSVCVLWWLYCIPSDLRGMNALKVIPTPTPNPRKKETKI